MRYPDARRSTHPSAIPPIASRPGEPQGSRHVHPGPPRRGESARGPQAAAARNIMSDDGREPGTARDVLTLDVDPDRHLALQGRAHEPWVRRVVLALLTFGVLLALANVFGQRPRTSSATTAQATMRVQAPSRLRGGDLYQGRVDITAIRGLKHPTLVLGTGWTEQMQFNTIEPSPTSETAPDGRLHLGFAAMKAGDRLTVWMQLEANPVSRGTHDQTVELRDDATPIITLSRRLTVFP